MNSALAVPPALRGVQEPRISSVPPYASSSGAEAIELAALAGLKLDPWQRSVLSESLGESSDWKCSECTYRSRALVACPDHPRARMVHPWAAFEVGLVVARQNGKSELMVARMLAGAFLLGERLIIYSAHQFDTAMEVFHRLVSVVESCPTLVKKVRLNRGKIGTYSHGSEGITLKSGQRIRFKARTSGGGRGFSCDCLMLDEAMILPEAFLGATIPTLSARTNPQIWMAGSAVDQQVHEHGIVLAKRRERGMCGGDPTLAYFEWSAEGDDPETADLSPEDIANANPGLGIRISPEYVAGERVAMGRRNFNVERGGVGDWPDTSDDAGRVISKAAFAACAERDPENRVTSVPAFALDAKPDQTWAALAVCGARDDELAQFAILDHRRGTDWIVDICSTLQRQHRKAQFVIDAKGPLAFLIKELEDEGVKVLRASTEDYGNACSMFLEAVLTGSVRYPDPQPELDDALAGAKQAPLGDRWKWARRSSADISPLVAVTLAFWGHSRPRPRARFVSFA